MCSVWVVTKLFMVALVVIGFQIWPFREARLCVARDQHSLFFPCQTHLLCDNLLMIKFLNCVREGQPPSFWTMWKGSLKDEMWTCGCGQPYVILRSSVDCFKAERFFLYIHVSSWWNCLYLSIFIYPSFTNKHCERPCQNIAVLPIEVVFPLKDASQILKSVVLHSDWSEGVWLNSIVVLAGRQVRGIYLCTCSNTLWLLK